ncbi:hypothetical protein F5144DRAFT_50986 [Chaetomium tenue]|uniref:Uncharacterized protein n=1 Tax=Chaetomium tenue TaxID=1854479 RepID=A0ACB7PS02_9PEZI|nr:hypothetical protein F5144DRAFT_50986 [Chaetomium globosum]
MSAVKNLRAMFEQKGEASPPGRGRSPVPHAPSDSPRPLSKIRTSFVAIEKEGRMGIQREGSQDSISALRKHSGDSNATTPTTGTERSNPFDALAKSPSKLGPQTQSIFGSPRANTGAQDVARPAEAKVAKPELSPAAVVEPKVEPKVEAKPEPEAEKTEVKPEPKVEPKTEPKPEPKAEPKMKATPEPEPEPEPKTEPKTELKTESKPQAKAELKLELKPEPKTEEPKAEPKAQSKAEPKTPEESSFEAVASPASAATPQVDTPNGVASGKEPQKKGAKEASKPITRTTKPTPKPLAVGSASKPIAKPEKSPRGPRTPAATSAHHPVVKRTPEKKLHSAEKPVTPRATPTSKPAGPSSVKRPPPLQSSPANTGFVKPKVKSPTRPIKLPTGLTTHTASSGSKVNASRQSLSRASGTIHDPHTRPASRTSASTTGSGSNKAVSVKGQSSTINRSRPSLGPPPKQPVTDYPPKKEKEVDQGFLARMMRPTASSASKATGKAHISPPRRTALAPKRARSVQPGKRAVSRSTVAISSSSTVKAIDTTNSAEGEVTPVAGQAGDEAASPTEGDAGAVVAENGNALEAATA